VAQFLALMIHGVFSHGPGETMKKTGRIWGAHFVGPIHRTGIKSNVGPGELQFKKPGEFGVPKIFYHC